MRKNDKNLDAERKFPPHRWRKLCKCVLFLFSARSAPSEECRRHMPSQHLGLLQTFHTQDRTPKFVSILAYENWTSPHPRQPTNHQNISSTRCFPSCKQRAFPCTHDYLSISSSLPFLSHLPLPTLPSRMTTVERDGGLFHCYVNKTCQQQLGALSFQAVIGKSKALAH